MTTELRMPSTNVVVVSGRLTRDPEYRHTLGGAAMCTFHIAHSEPEHVNGEKREVVTYIEVKCFKRQAEFVGDYVRKGRPVMVIGKLRDEVNTAGGKDRRFKVVYARQVEVLDYDTANMAT